MGLLVEQEYDNIVRDFVINDRLLVTSYKKPSLKYIFLFYILTPLYLILAFI